MKNYRHKRISPKDRKRLIELGYSPKNISIELIDNIFKADDRANRGNKGVVKNKEWFGNCGVDWWWQRNPFLGITLTEFDKEIDCKMDRLIYLIEEKSISEKILLKHLVKL